ncbi:MAG: choice-of-anchor A family protein [Scytonematopsis contorta HA4267-MV1]|jgi:choice-of-anchor A domain-containing protein|nr:choice-of-anchor A family protein [Scytonematopsis contorta HA4267-MV1]
MRTNIAKVFYTCGFFVVATTGMALFGFWQTAEAASLGVASDYNVFVLGDIQQQSTDIEGKLAAGGNINFIGGIGSRLSPNSGNVVVAGKKLQLSNSQVFNGNAVYGDSKDIASNVGLPQGTISQGNPIDFSTVEERLKKLSAYLASLAPTGKKRVEAWGGINFAGSGNKLDVFNLSGAELSKTNSLEINASPESTVVVNVSGLDISMKNFGFNLRGVDRKNVLYNFYEATNLNASEIAIEGSILAPFANFAFNNGQVNGNVVVKSMSGNGESHNYLFAGVLPDVPSTIDDPGKEIEKEPVIPIFESETIPEPSTISGLVVILGSLGFSRRKRLLSK